jgi:hypothetical protein
MEIESINIYDEFILNMIWTYESNLDHVVHTELEYFLGFALHTGSLQHSPCVLHTPSILPAANGI